jgi:hypothetical protein
VAKAAVTDKAGYFEIERVADGKYLVKVSAVGYANYFSKPVEISASNPVATIGNINLTVANKNLGTVQVTTTRPFIENKIDKTIVNVEASVTNVGSTALEVLEKSPGITVDRDGNISP